MKSDNDNSAWWCYAAVAVVFLCGFAICEQRAESNRTGRSVPTYDEAIQRNMSQSGVDDVTIPLQTRQEYARRKGLEVPTR